MPRIRAKQLPDADIITEAEAKSGNVNLNPVKVKQLVYDSSIDPAGAAIGTRYAMNGSPSLHANFGSPTFAADDILIKNDSGNWVVEYDSSVEGDGAVCWITDDNG
tara:strand:+ start:147 stop:464 length:318 start_codon:yes stop_codon:yes gene_type:complete